MTLLELWKDPDFALNTLIHKINLALKPMPMLDLHDAFSLVHLCAYSIAQISKKMFY